MKRTLFLIISLFSINTVKAFNIDINEISVNKQSNELIENLDKNYQIDLENFSNDENIPDHLIKLTKELVNISLNSQNIQKDLSKYIYIDNNNGVNTLTSNLFIEMFANDISSNDIEYNGIKTIRKIESEEGTIMFVYLDNTTVNDNKEEMILVYWLKEVNGEYKLHMPWYTLGSSLKEYFDKISQNEKNGKILSGTYKELSLTGKKNNIDSSLQEKIYTENKNSIVSITGMKENGINTYGSGFFIREGIVVTSYSIFKKFLSDSDFIYINDTAGNTFNIEGIVSSNVDYDVIILKLNKETGKKVTFTDSDELKIDDQVMIINSIDNINYSLKYGTFISANNGKLKNLLAVNKDEIGSALFNESGKVVGFVSSDLTNSELSIANSTNYLIKLQNILTKEKFNSINSTKLNIFKDKYYNSKNEEEIINTIPEKIWNKYKKIGDLENTINLELVKGSYEDKILSLRYKNNIIKNLDTLYLINDFEENLINSGFNKKLNNYNKLIYMNEKYKIIIKTEMDYLIILIMEK